MGRLVRGRQYTGEAMFGRPPKLKGGASREVFALTQPFYRIGKGKSAYRNLAKVVAEAEKALERDPASLRAEYEREQRQTRKR